MIFTSDAEPIAQFRGVELILKSDAGDINILKKIDLDVRQGEKLAIVGPSGSGKTSLLMVMAGLESVTSGSIKVIGREITRLNENTLADFRRDNLGLVFQSFHLIPTMTAIENVAIAMELAGYENAFEKAKFTLNEVGLRHRLSHFPGELSGGEQQRVALARAYAVKPNLLLADEPTGNLDSETGARIADLMFNLADRDNTTLILITHDQTVAERCDRIISIVDGKISNGLLNDYLVDSI